ncbi:unnamed protein product [Auanema sp. JU1783]|nr:unnamed protein product [Auanema sp. JU1783]
MLMLCQLVLFLLISQVRTSTIQVRAQRSFFDFFSKAGHYLIDTEIPKVYIPNITIPITDGPGNGSVSATNLKITKFLTPHIDFQLGDDGILWQSYGGAVKITGDWAAQYAIIIPFYENGWVKSVAVGLNVTLAASVYMEEYKPQFHIMKCLAAIDDLTVEVGGGVVPWLINLFRTPLSSAIRSIINKQACVAAKTIFLIQANEFIKSLPSHIQLNKNFYAHYSLDDNPRFTKKYVEADLSADLVFGDVPCKLDRQPWTNPGPNPRMVTVWMSDAIPNCFLSTIQQAGGFRFVVTKDEPEMERYLRTSCSLLSICIGKFFPELRKSYPDSYVDLFFNTYEEPLIIYEKDDIRANFTFSVDMYINPYQTYSDPLARLVLQTSSSVTPLIEGHKVIGTLNDTTVNLRQDFSRIGNMSSTFMSVFANVFKMSAKVLIETVLAKGISIPVMDNVTISDDSEITVLDRHIRLNLDFKLQ